MKKFPLIADTIFYAFCALTLSFCVLRYYKIPLAGAIAIAVCIALPIGILSFLLLNRSHKRKLFSSKQREEQEKLLLHLALEKPERVRAAFIAAFTADEKEAHCAGDELIVDDQLTVPLFTMEPVSADGIAHLLRRYGSGFALICNTLTVDAEKLLSSFSISVTKRDEVYALFTRTKTMPSPLICGNLPRKTIKQRMKVTFSKKNARAFFVSGILLLIMSLFVFFPLYYMITGSVLLLCAVTVRIFGYA